MTTPRACPECGAELAPDAPDSPCPACLMKLGLASWSARRYDEADSGGAVTTPPPKKFRAKTPEELAPHFPQLEILELLGQGGMGAVYKARQPELDRIVALKILPEEVCHDPAFAERFMREARTLAKLNHPHVVSIYDFGRADGLYYFLMEYVDGVNLREMARRQRLAPREALALAGQICDALQFAHEEGVVHRDVKPENILIDKRGRLKIADFGLAKLLGKRPGDLTLTHAQQVMGTVHYMAPEQMQGSSSVDHRADIYSLGVVLYEMLTGELPLGRFAPPSVRAQIDVRLDEIVLRALEREPERRYQHASEVKTDVERVSHEERPAAPSAPPAERPPTKHTTSGASVVLAVLGVLILLAAPALLIGVAVLSFVLDFGGIGIMQLIAVGVMVLIPAGALGLLLLVLSRSYARSPRDASRAEDKSPVENAAWEEARRQAAAPGVGLMIVAVLNGLLIVLALLAAGSLTLVREAPRPRSAPSSVQPLEVTKIPVE